MRSVVGTARNFYLVPSSNGKVVPLVEAIIVTAEPSYEVPQKKDKTEGLKRVLTHESLRFTTTIEGLHILADTFRIWAAELEDILRDKNKKGGAADHES